MSATDTTPAPTWHYKEEEASAAELHHPTEEITWTGSEFIAEQKDAKWYAGLTGAIFVCCLVTFFVTKHDILSVVSIAIIGILFGVLAGRKPRQLTYRIDKHGVTIDKKQYPYAMFKSFDLQHEGMIGYISLLPLHRFQFEISVYFAPEDEQRIFDTLASYLPHEPRKQHVFDRIMKRVRF